MINLLRNHKHLFAIIAPIIICLIILLFLFPALTGPINFFESAYILTLTGGQPIFGLRLLPVMIIFLLVLFSFHFAKRWGFRRATITMTILATLLMVSYRLILIPTAEETDLKDIAVTVWQFTDDCESIRSAESIPSAVRFYLDGPSCETESYWLITPVSEEVSVNNGYRIASQASNQHFTATHFIPSED